MKNVYKLRHKETGLFLDPKGSCSNVSVEGKVYSNKKPPRQRFIALPNEIRGQYEARYETELTDWEVVEYKLVEVSNVPDSKEEFREGEGQMMSLSEFQDAVGWGLLTDDDGSGSYSDGRYVLSDVDLGDISEGYSHVIWYNK